MKSRFYYIISLFLFFILFSLQASAQKNYVLLKKGDYEEYDEKPVFKPDARIGGEFFLLYVADKEGSFEGGDGHTWRNDFTLRFRSEVNTNISLNLALSNKPYYVADRRTSYYKSKEQQELGNSTSNENQEPVITEAFLEYNHNPMAVFRLGRQEFTVGDREGLVYRGNQQALTQTCKMGTWCYWIGGAQMGPLDGDFLYWAQITNPVYETGKKKKDLWNLKKQRDVESLKVELFRIFHNELDLPLAEYGGRTWIKTVDDGTLNNYQQTYSGKNVFFDIKEEYFGFNLEWLFDSASLHFNYVQQAGYRVYHTGTRDSTDDMVDISRPSHQGIAWRLKGTVNPTPTERIGMDILVTTGDDTRTGSEKIWDNSSTAFYEINRGTFGDARIYLSGYDRIGQGHSVNNLTYYSLFFSHRTEDEKFGFDVNAYQFKRSKPVLNSDGNEVSLIGNEIDFSFLWRTQKRMEFGLNFDFFQVKEAYSPSDNIAPDNDAEDFSKISLSMQYKF